MPQRTVADILTLNDRNASDVETSDLINRSPLLARMHSGPSSNGTNHKYLKETGAPIVGYRAVDSGIDTGDASETQVSVDLEIISGNIEVDQRKADGYRKGGAPGYIARNGRQSIRQQLYVTERQFLRGQVDADANGFSGLSDAYNALASANVVGAGGTGSACCSAWLIRTSDDEEDLMFVGMGQNGEGNDEVDSINIHMGDVFQGFALDGSDKKYPVYGQSVEGYLGFQLGSIYSAFRLANLSVAAGLDDDLMSQVEELVPTHKQNDLLWVMNRRSAGQLQRSRQAIQTTGAIGPVPKRSVNDIEIVVVESLTNDETVVV